MDAVNEIDSLPRTILCNLANTYRVQDVRTLPIFDEQTGNYLLLDEGWSGYKRYHHVWAHIEARNGKYYIHEDGTEGGIANHLLKAGVPNEQIVLSLDAPTLRQDSGFALD